MNSGKSHIIFFLSAITGCLTGCVEPFTPETEVFQAALVVEAHLTDEEKQHEVLLSRARPFEQDSISAESNAKVSIINDLGATYNFSELSPGRYVSDIQFSAKQNSSYQLAIGTADGKSYLSEMVTTPEKVAIGALKAERGNNGFGEDGVNILIDASSTTAAANYFLYEYEETYKIIAPDWDPHEFDIIDSIACEHPNIGYEVGIKVRVRPNRVCYKTLESTRILQTATNSLDKNEVSNFSIRFLHSNDFAITHRYSIMVKQHVQTLEAYSYYQNLNIFSTSDNVFSENQPGFLAGNINAQSNADEKVVGYFEVTTVNSERIYFNYPDVFPGEALPPYPITCSGLSNPPLYNRGFHCDFITNTCDGTCQSPLINAIQAGLIVYVLDNENYDGIGIDMGPYFAKPFACGDCTALGSNVVPDFWEE